MIYCPGDGTRWKAAKSISEITTFHTEGVWTNDQQCRGPIIPCHQETRQIIHDIMSKLDHWEMTSSCLIITADKTPEQPLFILLCLWELQVESLYLHFISAPHGTHLDFVTLKSSARWLVLVWALVSVMSQINLNFAATHFKPDEINYIAL